MLFLVSSLLAVALAVPIVPEAPAIDTQNLYSYGYALDFSQLVSVSQFQCMKQNGYQAVFVRGYNPSGNGYLDLNGCGNIQNAYQAGVGTEVYMTPQPNSNKLGYQQLDEMYDGLVSKGITVRQVWIQVTSPVNWPTGYNGNINFISSILSRCRQRGIGVAIYTNQYDWNQITGGWTSAGTDVGLWYWNVNGAGVGGETAPNFNDFRPFGCWTTPSAKQFAQVETVCSVTVNRDVYAIGNSAAGMAKFEKTGPIAGNVITF